MSWAKRSGSLKRHGIPPSVLALLILSVAPVAGADVTSRCAPPLHTHTHFLPQTGSAGSVFSPQRIYFLRLEVIKSVETQIYEEEMGWKLSFKRPQVSSKKIDVNELNVVDSPNVSFMSPQSLKSRCFNSECAMFAFIPTQHPLAVVFNLRSRPSFSTELPDVIISLTAGRRRRPHFIHRWNGATKKTRREKLRKKKKTSEN